MRGSREAKTFASRLLEDPVYQTNLRIRLREGTLPANLEALLWHYKWGKPADTLNVNETPADRPSDRPMTRVERAQHLLELAKRLEESPDKDPEDSDGAVH